MQRGYIKLWRKTFDNPCMRKPKVLALWVTLLMLANHKDRDELLGTKRITCRPGQFTCGRNQLSKETGIHRSSIERILKILEIEHQIEQRKTSVNRLITITNWNRYQQSEQPSEQRASNDRATIEQRSSTLKECKNVRMKESIEAFTSKQEQDLKEEVSKNYGWDVTSEATSDKVSGIIKMVLSKKNVKNPMGYAIRAIQKERDKS